MYGKRKVIADISVSELLSLREQGMTNREIANSQAISYGTVLKLIGKQPKGMNVGRVRGGGQVQDVEKECTMAALSVAPKKIEMTGAVCCYTAYPGCTDIEVLNKNDSRSYTLKIEDIPTLIRELQAIQRNVDKLANRLEVW